MIVHGCEIPQEVIRAADGFMQGAPSFQAGDLQRFIRDRLNPEILTIQDADTVAMRAADRLIQWNYRHNRIRKVKPPVGRLYWQWKGCAA